MKMTSGSRRPGGLLTKKTLKQLVDELSSGVLATAVRRGSFIVNDVPGELIIATNENMLATVLNGLMHTAVSNAENSCIRITARVYGNIILVHVLDTRKSDNHAITDMLGEMQPLAEKIGGCVTVCNQREKIITLAFSFLNLPSAA